MAPTPHRIAQTSTELKRQHRKNGTVVSERQQKQLAREVELNQRAAQAREAEERRKAAAKKRKEKEAKEAAARKQLGVGLATQLIGYSHTQAQLKQGMESFLGLNKKKEEEKRKKEAEIQKMLEDVISVIENEPSDDDENQNDNAQSKPSLEEWADDDVDDESLLEIHDMMVSKTADECLPNSRPQPAPISHTTLAQPLPSNPSTPCPARENLEFIRTHGPINKIVEAVLDKLPGPIIELLSQDVSLKILEWDPAAGLLHKLNPVGLPPHRLRVKVGCVVTLLRDWNTGNRISKSQRLRILRLENDRLECLVLDGQLSGIKINLARVAFHSKYRNRHTFERTQFPICVAPDLIQPQLPPPAEGCIPSVIPPKKSAPPVPPAKSTATVYPGFKLPGLPASRCSSSDTFKITPAVQIPQSISPLSTDCWDDFFESSTQISREIDSEANPQTAETNSNLVAPSPSMTDDFPPIYTQDLDFSLDDLDDAPNDAVYDERKSQLSTTMSKKLSPPISEKAACRPTQGINTTHTPTRSSVVANSSRPLASTKKIAGKCRNPGPFATGLEIELAKLRPSQLPKSMFGSPVKRKATAAPSKAHVPPATRPRMANSHPSFPFETAASKATDASFDDFLMSTQDVAAFFDDDDTLSFGSPPIAV